MQQETDLEYTFSCGIWKITLKIVFIFEEVRSWAMKAKDLFYLFILFIYLTQFKYDCIPQRGSQLLVPGTVPY